MCGIFKNANRMNILSMIAASGATELEEDDMYMSRVTLLV